MMKTIVIASMSLLFGAYASALSAGALGAGALGALCAGAVAAAAPPGIAAAIQILKAPLAVCGEEDFSANYVTGYDHNSASSVGCGCLACADRYAAESFEEKALRLREQADANGFPPEAYELAAEMRSYYDGLIAATFPERVALDMVEEEYGTPLSDAWCYEELDAMRRDTYEPLPLDAPNATRFVEQPHAPDLLTDARTRHDQVALAYSDAERDIDTLLDLPGLFDLNEEPARILVNALGAAQDLASVLPNDPPRSDLLAYSAAVRDAENAWKAARQHARLVSLSRFAPGEREKIETAHKALTRAMHSTTPEHERRTAYRHALRLLDGLIALPEQAIAVIEQRVRGELSSAG